MTRRRQALAALSALMVVGGLLWGWRAPALTLTNAALVARYPVAAPGGRLLAALGCGLLALLLRGRGRLVALAPAAAFLVVGLYQLAYRIQADADGIESRGLFGHDRLPWAQVQRTDPTEDTLEVVGPAGRVLVLRVGGLLRADRESLERTLKRRVREAAQPAPAAPQPVATP